MALRKRHLATGWRSYGKHQKQNSVCSAPATKRLSRRFSRKTLGLPTKMTPIERMGSFMMVSKCISASTMPPSTYNK